MSIIKILIGFLDLFFAWGLLFQAGLIFKINAWIRERIFNDQLILFSRRRLAVLLTLLGGVALFSGVDNVINFQRVNPEVLERVLDQARGEFHLHHYPHVISRCKQILRSSPENLETWELLEMSYWATNEKSQAQN